MLWATKSHFDPEWSRMTQIFTLWPTVTQNLVCSFTLIQNKILGLYIFLNFLHKINFLGKFGPETWNVLKLDKKGYSRLLILSLSIFSVFPFRTLFKKILSQNFKVLCLEWKSVQSNLQGCRLRIWQLFSQVPSLK